MTDETLGCARAIRSVFGHRLVGRVPRRRVADMTRIGRCDLGHLFFIDGCASCAVRLTMRRSVVIPRPSALTEYVIRADQDRAVEARNGAARMRRWAYYRMTHPDIFTAGHDWRADR